MRIKFKPIYYFLIILFNLSIFISSAHATEKYAGEFLNIGVGARALGMGGSFAAIADDATTAYWNPAGLGSIKNTQIAFMHTGIFGLDKYDFVNCIQPISKSSTLGLSWIRLGIDDIPITELSKPGDMSASNRPVIVGYMHDTENAFIFSYGKRIKSPIQMNDFDINIGGNTKFIYNSVSGIRRNAIGFGGDLGILCRKSLLTDRNENKRNFISLGVTAQDFFKTRIIWNTTSSPSHTDIIQPNIKIGVAYSQFINSISSRMTFTMDANTRYGLETNYGIEYNLGNLLSLRTGIQNSNFTAGAGLNIAFARGSSELSFLIDYAFLSHELGNTHRISAMTKF